VVPSLFSDDRHQPKGATMASPSLDSGHILVMQRGQSEPEVHKNISADEATNVVSRADEKVAQDLLVANQRITAITRDIITDPDRTVEHYILEYSRTRTAEVLNQDLESLTPEKHKSRIDEYHRYSAMGTAVLYSDSQFKGSWKFFTATWPNFGWSPYRFNDKASSARVWGVNILFEHSWYRGRRLYLIGLPYAQFEDLSAFDFNDKASSILCGP
jgi:hypothetical protein